MIANHSTAAAVASQKTAALGELPEWNLADLYAGMDAPELKHDLDKAMSDSIAFEDRWKGKLASEAGKGANTTLGECLKQYEALEELIGRVVSYASLLYAGNTTDPRRAKLYGDIQEKMTDASAHLLFFPLELNLVDDALIGAALDANTAFGHYRPWVLDLRKDKPYQLEDRVEQLFHEKSITGRGAWNRLFDETMADLRFEIEGETLTLEPALNRLQDANPEKRRLASEALAKTFKQNLRTFTLITNTLAKDKEIGDRWRGFEDIADSRHLANRVERSVVDALAAAVREAYPRLSHRYYAMKAKWLGMEALNHWDRNAPLPETPQAVIGWEEAKETVLSAYAGFAPEMAEIALPFFERRWIDAPVRPGKAPGAFAHPTVPSAHPYVLLNYQGKPRDVMTLAHELGHGVHQVLAARQGALMAHTPLTLAETASVFGELEQRGRFRLGQRDDGACLRRRRQHLVQHQDGVDGAFQRIRVGRHVLHALFGLVPDGRIAGARSVAFNAGGDEGIHLEVLELGALLAEVVHVGRRAHQRHVHGVDADLLGHEVVILLFRSLGDELVAIHVALGLLALMVHQEVDPVRLSAELAGSGQHAVRPLQLHYEEAGRAPRRVGGPFEHHGAGHLRHAGSLAQRWPFWAEAHLVFWT